MDAMSYFVIFILFIFGFIYIQQNLINKKKEKIEIRLKGQPGFRTTQKLIGEDGLTGIAIDENSKKVCLINYDGDRAIAKTYSYKEVLSCEIFTDGNTMTKTSRSSQAGGALIGGVLLGGVGAIIGGLSGKKTAVEKVNRIDLRIVVNNTQKPIHDVNLFKGETSKNSMIHKAAAEKARHWHSLIAVLIRRADEEDKASEGQKQSEPTVPASVADEIAKLLELKEKGILTEEEFTQQKLKILS